MNLVYHGPHSEPYYVTDSAYGIGRAARAGFHGIDLNCRTCRANNWHFWTPWRRRIVVAHWAKWWENGFRARVGTHVPHRPIENLTLAQVRNLISDDGKHSIITAEQAVLIAKRWQIIPFFELKPSKYNVGILRRLKTFAAARRQPIAVMTIQAYGKTLAAKRRWENAAFNRMKMSKLAGLKTMLLYRRPLDWAKWTPVLDAIKDRAGNGSVLDLPSFITELEKNQ